MLNEWIIYVFDTRGTNTNHIKSCDWRLFFPRPWNQKGNHVGSSVEQEDAEFASVAKMGIANDQGGDSSLRE